MKRGISQEYSLRESDNKMERRTFGPKKEVQELRIHDLHNLHSSRNICKIISKNDKQADS
jgi:hypothetical protein